MSRELDEAKAHLQMDASALFVTKRDLTAAQLEIERLKAEVAARYTVEEVEGVLHIEKLDQGVIDSILGSLKANQRKEEIKSPTVMEVLNALPALLAELDEAKAKSAGLQARVDQYQAALATLTRQHYWLVKALEEITVAAVDDYTDAQARIKMGAIAHVALEAAKETS